jgi:hypothetical protein
MTVAKLFNPVVANKKGGKQTAGYGWLGWWLRVYGYPAHDQQNAGDFDGGRYLTQTSAITMPSRARKA